MRPFRRACSPRRAVAASTVVALLLAGCTASSLPSDAEVTISGRLTRADGSPAAGLTVVLHKEPDAGEVAGSLLASAATLGLLCLARAVELCKGARRTETDSTGAYTFRLTGRDTQGSFNSASTMALSAQLPGDAAPGPVVQARFKVQQTELTVPTLAFWEPADLAVRPDRGKISVRWSGQPAPKSGDTPRYTVTVTTSDTDASDVVWVAENMRPGATFDARAVGDLRGFLHVTATRKVKDSGTEFTTRHDSQRVRLVGPLGPPSSRGRECAAAGPEGEPEPLTPCTLTDGAYGQSYRLRSCREPNSSGSPPNPEATGSAPPPCQANTFLQVDLGDRRPVAAVFAHGLSATTSPVVVATSDDGIAWSRRAEGGPASFLTVTLPAGSAARYVRLSSSDGRPVSQLGELAVWP